MPNTPPDAVYRIWSNRYQQWWRPEAAGYTDDLDQAGRFTEPDAVYHTLRMAQPGRIDDAVVLVRVRTAVLE
jgi:hypothetical protein